MENNIKKLASRVGRISIVVVVIILAGGLMITVNKACRTAQKQEEGNASNTRPIFKTITNREWVGKGQTKRFPISESYPDYIISVDPTRRWGFTIEDASEGDNLFFQFYFPNGKRTGWLSANSHTEFSRDLQYKSFYVRVQKGTGTLVVVVQ